MAENLEHLDLLRALVFVQTKRQELVGELRMAAIVEQVMQEEVDRSAGSAARETPGASTGQRT